MADRPILFSGPMVRAILNGRKTQTRRVIKLGNRRPDYIGPKGCADDPSCWGWEKDDGDFWLVQRGEGDRQDQWSDWAGAYRAGDRLWVREAWRVYFQWDDTPPCRLPPRSMTVLFEAGGSIANNVGGVWEPSEWEPGPQSSDWIGKFRPSIHMLRWASRLTLHVTDVRVQRVQDITEADAVAEGVEPREIRAIPDRGNPPETWWFGTQNGRATPKSAFRDLWDSLNDKRGYGWMANPWVAAITFEARCQNIDRTLAGAA